MSLKSRMPWIEILLLGGILLIIASFALRIVYGQQMREAEARIVTSLGIGDGTYMAIKAIVAVFAIIYFGIRYGKSRTKP